MGPKSHVEYLSIQKGKCAKMDVLCSQKFFFIVVRFDGMCCCWICSMKQKLWKKYWFISILSIQQILKAAKALSAFKHIDSPDTSRVPKKSWFWSCWGTDITKRINHIFKLILLYLYGHQTYKYCKILYLFKAFWFKHDPRRSAKR